MAWYCPECGKGGRRVRGPAKHFCTAAGKVVDGNPKSGPRPPDRPSKWSKAGPAEGPGTELEKILRWFGVSKLAGCKCEKLKYQMNAWGAEGCRKRQCKIVHSLIAEANRRGWWFAGTIAAEETANFLVARAIAKTAT